MKSTSKKSPQSNANEIKDTSKQNGSKIGLTKEELAAKVEEKTLPPLSIVRFCCHAGERASVGSVGEARLGQECVSGSGDQGRGGPVMVGGVTRKTTRPLEADVAPWQ